MNLRTIDLRKLNSMTKYPSIPTYHVMDEKTHRLRDDVAVDFGGEPVWITEKIDGTNARMIFVPRAEPVVLAPGWLLGSREELLYAQGDLIGNPSQGIVAALRDLAAACAQRLAGELVASGRVIVIYGEVYGGNINAAAKNYSAKGAVGFRCFDVMTLEPDVWLEQFAKELPQISAWRESGGQPFWDQSKRDALARDCDLFSFVPEIATGTLGLGRAVAETASLLADLGVFTHAHLDPADGSPGSGGLREGVVVRNADRSKIAKLRFEDYERALGGGKKPRR